VNPVSAEIWENKEIATGIFRLKLRPYGPVLPVAPGRFFMIGLGPGRDPLLRRPLGHLANSVDENGIHLVEFLYEVRGRGTQALSLAQPPRIITFIGPLGQGWDLNPPPPRIIMAAGGMGLVPLFAAARALQLARPRPKIQFLFGAKTARGLTLVPELEKIAALACCTEDGCLGEQGLVTEPLRRALADPANQTAVVLACGPRPMLKAVARLALDAGINCQVSLEARMACGMGACLTCAVPGADGTLLHVCKDGPVFPASAIDWEALDAEP
jgi:dihydroorotate dehydrogenase electron transfer subunit